MHKIENESQDYKMSHSNQLIRSTYLIFTANGQDRKLKKKKKIAVPE